MVDRTKKFVSYLKETNSDSTLCSFVPVSSKRGVGSGTNIAYVAVKGLLVLQMCD
jgi:hypothetical protein